MVYKLLREYNNKRTGDKKRNSIIVGDRSSFVKRRENCGSGIRESCGAANAIDNRSEIANSGGTI